MLIKDKKVFITGGCSGMGRAIANRAIEGGSKVTIFDFAPQEKLEQVQKELGENCFIFRGDVTDEECVNAGIAYAVEKMGGLTSCVNAAGNGLFRSILDFPTKDFDWTVKLNLYGTFYCVRAESACLKELGNGGSIVNFSSMAATKIGATAAAYSASKAGVIAVTKAAAAELGQFGIRVNCVQPGLIHTELMAKDIAQPGYVDAVLGGNPIKRPGDPGDVANYVAYLLNDDACYITGTATPIDGGMNIG